MDLRLALYQWVGLHGLNAAQQARLEELAGLGAEPPALARRMRQGLAVLAAGLGGFGLILWLAANWGSLGRFGRFGLLEALLLLLGIAACSLGRRRAALAPALGLMVLLLQGGLFAYFGQTYQTGADPWQLFALWALLALPLALGLRSDVLWTPWALVAMTAVSLWAANRLGHAWHFAPGAWQVYLLSWGFSFALLLALAAPLRPWTGAGVWSWRLALSLAVFNLGFTGLLSLFSQQLSPIYLLALGLLGLGAWLLSRPHGFEVYGLSLLTLALNVLLVCGLGRLLLQDRHGDPVGEFFILTLVAAGLLALSVKWLLGLSRRHEAPLVQGVAQ
ncbi:putative membrane protein [Paucibacter oligotrophus]|uniref:Putative membrane protein n=1 Tax=Roseateles oligotrophus TaxID=1769250 RepID=A0A840L9B9_9BURK|nr:DUF2157 domain-containing protein [Roseateles oligotrophus]MBB4843355.1 putative membrane protein [Roseateles oligotrophus]